MRSFTAFITVLLAAAVLASAAGAVHGQVASCPASAVHYRSASHTPDGVAGVPWIATTNSAFRGYLFYWGGTHWGRARAQTARIFTTAAKVNINPKVLWVALRPAGQALAIKGRRLDGPGTFAARYPAATGGGQFPSYVSVPAAGCWRVTVSSGTLHGAVTFQATNSG